MCQSSLFYIFVTFTSYTFTHFYLIKKIECLLSMYNTEMQVLILLLKNGKEKLFILTKSSILKLLINVINTCRFLLYNHK